MNYILIWLAFINVLSAVITAYDKNAAIKYHYRVPERALLLIAFAGGAFSMLVVMKLIRHKTRHIKFMLLLPLFILLQALALFLFLYNGAI